uniref:Putative secreted protein n=1 Tax=Ixodes ricinus TaxID=34613 RepID=A0A6B0U2C3_IXORI
MAYLLIVYIIFRFHHTAAILIDRAVVGSFALWVYICSIQPTNHPHHVHVITRSPYGETRLIVSKKQLIILIYITCISLLSD